MKTIIAIIAALIAAQAHAELHKCATQEGKTIYSDMPCPSGATKTNTIKPDREPAHIEFSGNNQADLVRIVGTLDSIQNMGSTCQIDIKVYGGVPASCITFNRQVLEGGPYKQALRRYLQIIDDEETMKANVSLINQARRHVENIARYNAFVESTVKARGR
jgi:hypothetical protein